ncbi:Protein Iojap, chloroplastic [Linum perenne]
MIASLPIAGDLLPIESNLSRRIDKRSSRTLGIRKLCFSQSKSRNFYPTFALRKDDNLLTNSEDSEEALDDLLNKYGKVVFRRNDEKGLVAEVDDDAETLSFAVELAKVASDVKAGDIKVLFVKPLVYWTRFFHNSHCVFSSTDRCNWVEDKRSC